MLPEAGGSMEEPKLIPCWVCGEEFSTPQQLELHRHEKHLQADASDRPQRQVRERSQYEERGEVF